MEGGRISIQDTFKSGNWKAPHFHFHLNSHSPGEKRKERYQDVCPSVGHGCAVAVLVDGDFDGALSRVVLVAML
jgi:hypothetical protein